MRLGLTYTEFWELTPREVDLVMRARVQALKIEHNQRAWMVHQGAMLQRAKKIPPLRQMQVRVTELVQRTPQEIGNVFKHWVGALGGKFRQLPKKDD